MTMARVLRCAIVLLLADNTMINLRVFGRETTTVAESLAANKVVPDVIPKAPAALVDVRYPSGVKVMLGNELRPAKVQDQPTLTWNACPDQLYTVVMTDPDVPSRKLAVLREFLHWLVGNVSGNDIGSGVTLSPYIGSQPPVATGLHRYVFLVYKQPSKLDFDLVSKLGLNRVKFSIARFAKKYNLGDAIAGNFFQAQFDGSVPIWNNKLGV